MSAMQMTEPFAIVPRQLNAVSAGACLKGCSQTVDGATPTRYCAKYRSAISFTSARMSCDSNRGCNSQPAAVIKSP